MTVADFFSTAQAYASAAAEGEHHGPSINDIWFPVVNFIIYAFIIVKFALPLIRDFLKTRREEVVAKIAQASAKKQAAEALVRDYRSKLAGLGKEVQSLQAMLREEGEREKSFHRVHPCVRTVRPYTNFPPSRACPGVCGSSSGRGLRSSGTAAEPAPPAPGPPR